VHTDSHHQPDRQPNGHTQCDAGPDPAQNRYRTVPVLLSTGTVLGAICPDRPERGGIVLRYRRRTES